MLDDLGFIVDRITYRYLTHRCAINGRQNKKPLSQATSAVYTLCRAIGRARNLINLPTARVEPTASGLRAKIRV